MSKHHSLVNEQLDAEDYADEYADDQSWRDHRDAAKARGEWVEKETKKKSAAAAAPKPKPKPAPKVVVKAEPKVETQKEETPFIVDKEPILEAVDDWEAAMDALDAHVSAQEAKKADQAAKLNQR
jgi:hypothetical protein